MITEADIYRLLSDKNKVEKLITNAMIACKRSTTDWSKDYWFGVFEKLCKKYERTDLFNKYLH